MDPYIKGHLEAIGQRLLELARSNPEAYVRSQMETTEWRRDWDMDHDVELKHVNAALSLEQFRRMKEFIETAVADDPSVLDRPIPPPLQHLFPHAANAKEWLRCMEDMMADIVMTAVSEE